MFKIVQAIIYLPVKIFFPTKVIGRKNLPKGKAILACNHRSNVDAFLLATSIYKKQYYLAKQELFKGKVKTCFFKSLGGIPVNRSNVELSTIKEVLGVLKKDKKVVIFPEGTRNKDENLELGAVKNGIVLFAVKSKTSIVPIWLEKKPKLFRFNRLIIGNPFTLEEFYDKKLTSEIIDEAGEKVKQQLLLTKDYKIKKS